MVAQLQRGGRLPSNSAADDAPSLRSLLQLYGNGAHQQDMGIQRFEDIGESNDEHALIDGTLIPQAQQPDSDFLYGGLVRDEGALKWEGGLLRPEGNGIGLVNGSGQGGVWQDDDGNWNAGGQGQFGVVDGAYDFVGDPGEDDGYIRLEGSLLSANGGARIGTDGGELTGEASALSLGLAMGTGAHADSANDCSLSVGASAGSVGSSEGLWLSDVDQDGVSELNIHGALAVGGGLDVGVSSEQLGGLWDSAVDWFTG